MAYATNEERLELIKSNQAFGLHWVVRAVSWRGEVEIACDGFDHAYNVAMEWKHVRKADHVAMHRVDQTDGSLYGGIGEI